MSALQPKIQHLTLADYQTKPWKNGKGQTQDIILLPEDADHSSFEVRIALSPIVEKGPFSSFSGADRVITLIKGAGLSLEFDSSTKSIKTFESLNFDTGLAPIGEPIGGPVRVVNVMARRDVWRIESCMLTTELDVVCDQDELMFVFALKEGCTLSTQDVDVTLNQYDSFLINEQTVLKLNNPNNEQVLFAHLKPVSC